MKVINGNLAFAAHGEAPLRLDPSALHSVFCYGDVSVTAAALESLFRHGIETAWLTAGGQRCRGRATRIDPSTTLTRIRQHRAFARPEACLDWARQVVIGKIETQTQATRHHQRHGCALAGPVLAQLQQWQVRVLRQVC